MSSARRWLKTLAELTALALCSQLLVANSLVDCDLPEGRYKIQSTCLDGGTTSGVVLIESGDTGASCILVGGLDYGIPEQFDSANQTLSGLVDGEERNCEYDALEDTLLLQCADEQAQVCGATLTPS